MSSLAGDGGEEAGGARADAGGGSTCASRHAGAARCGARARNRRRAKLFAGLATALRGLQVVCVERCLAFQRLSLPSPSPASHSVTQSVTAPALQQQQRSPSKGIGMATPLYAPPPTTLLCTLLLPLLSSLFPLLPQYSLPSLPTPALPSLRTLLLPLQPRRLGMLRGLLQSASLSQPLSPSLCLPASVSRVCRRHVLLYLSLCVLIILYAVYVSSYYCKY